MKASKELKIGAFAIIIMVMSFFLINYLRGEDIFNREIELVSYYENIEGLAESSPVFIKGYKAGKVVEVSYQKDIEAFKVVCSVSKDFRIPSDSKMTIYGMDIMGTKAVKLELGTSAESMEDGGRLASAYEAGMIDGLAANIEPLLNKVNNTLDSLTVTVSGVNRVLSVENQNRISNTLAHIERTMNNASRLTGSLEGKSEEIEDFVANLSKLSSQFNSIAEKVDGTMGDVSEIASSLSESDIKELVDSFKEIVDKVNSPEGTVGKLLVDNSVHDSVDSLISDIDELIKKIQENPKKYIKISIF